MEIVAVQRSQLGSVHAGLMRVYAAAFSLPPYNESEKDFEAFAERLPCDADSPGFRCVVARAGAGIVGFAYGMAFDEENSWMCCIRDALEPEDQRELENSWFVAELAVMPELHGEGIGRELHDALIEPLSYEHIFLTTIAKETPALELFLSAGYRSLRLDFKCQHMATPYVILAKRVHLPPATSGPTERAPLVLNYADPRSPSFDPDRVEHDAFVQAFEELKRSRTEMPPLRPQSIRFDGHTRAAPLLD